MENFDLPRKVLALILMTLAADGSLNNQPLEQTESNQLYMLV
jgi:hypothetical protein